MLIMISGKAQQDLETLLLPKLWESESMWHVERLILTSSTAASTVIKHFFKPWLEGEARLKVLPSPYRKQLPRPSMCPFLGYGGGVRGKSGTI